MLFAHVLVVLYSVCSALLYTARTCYAILWLILIIITPLSCLFIAGGLGFVVLCMLVMLTYTSTLAVWVGRGGEVG